MSFNLKHLGLSLVVQYYLVTASATSHATSMESNATQNMTIKKTYSTVEESYEFLKNGICSQYSENVQK